MNPTYEGNDSMFDLKLIEKKGCAILIVLLLIAMVGKVEANPRYASIVIHADTGHVLHEANADAGRYPASLTKMMTLYMLFEALEQGKITLDTRMSVSVHAASMPQTNIGLRAGRKLSVRDAIPALIVRLANDVAVVVAEALGQTESNFGRIMTEKARALGMFATTFRNASGLPNRVQKTTARDMVTLSAHLMKDFPKFYHYFSTQAFSYEGTTYRSHNRMVRNIPGVDGLKTGFIRASGFNVATSAKRGNCRVIGVVMGGRTAASRDRHMAKLLDRSFKKAITTQMTRKMVADAPIPSIKPTVLMKPRPDPAAILRGELSTITTIIEPTVVSQTQDDWAVQIGSYHESGRAHAQAEAATRWVQGQVSIVEVEISNRTFYRALLVGLQKKQARNACQSLSRQGLDCMVVRSHG